MYPDIAIKPMGKIDPIARVVTIVGGKLAAVGGCDDVFGRAESAPWESAHIAMPNAFLGVAKFWSRATPTVDFRITWDLAAPQSQTQTEDIDC